MSAVISVENLSKKYIIGHKNQERYVALRDVIAQGAKNIWQKVKHPLGGHDSSDPLYEEFFALKDVSFEIKQGDRVGIIGRNGAGKSTLLKVLSRITEPSSGRIKIKGRVASLLEVGTGFHPELTGRENIFLNGAILGMSKAEIIKKFDEIVAFAEVEKFLDTPVKRYSSGMYVRLAFAVAAHLEPEILIVDEVLSVGDAAFQKKCLGKMEDISKKEGSTILFVSHNLAMIKQLSKEGILIDKGQIKSLGHIEPVVNHYYLTNLGSQRNSAILDLSTYRNPFGNGELFIESLELLNPVENSFAIQWDQPIKLKFNLKVHTPLKKVGFANSFQNQDNAIIFTIRNTDYQSWFDLSLGNTFCIMLEISHPLRADIFNIMLGVYDDKNYVFYHHPSMARIEILANAEKTYQENNYGVINCQSQWKLSKG